MKSTKSQGRNELIAIIRRQQQEIESLRQRNKDLQESDIGLLRRERDELKAREAHVEAESQELMLRAAIAQSLAHFSAIGLLALLGEGLVEAMRNIPSAIDENQQTAMREKFGEFVANLVDAAAKIDVISKEAWEKQRRIIEIRVATLPPLKRALFRALDELAQPSKLGSRLSMFLLREFDYEQELNPAQLDTVKQLTQILDTASDLWPLASVNSLLPLLRYVGFDDAAEAAGEILDSLAETKTVPSGLIHRVRSDLVAMGAVPEQAKPSTIRQYLLDGYQLHLSEYSPDFAAARGLIPGSPTQLKRANRAYSGLIALYERLTPLRSDHAFEDLNWFSAVIQAANRLVREKSEKSAKPSPSLPARTSTSIHRVSEKEYGNEQSAETWGSAV